MYNLQQTTIKHFPSFSLAQKAVIHPAASFPDFREHRSAFFGVSVEPFGIGASGKLFRLCDLDKAFSLNDFQEECFGSILQSQELEGNRDLLLQTPIEGNHSFSYDHLSAYGESNASHHQKGGDRMFLLQGIKIIHV